ncbi:histidine phosphatase family protein [Humidesulfovibrio sp.]
MNDILAQLLAALERGESLAQATILTHEGSTPRSAGSRMLLTAEGGGVRIVAGTVGGESFRQVQERAWHALQSILAEHSGLLLVVAHAGVNRALICRLIGLPLQQLFLLGQDYCGLTVLECPPQNAYRLAALNLAPGSPLALG